MENNSTLCGIKIKPPSKSTARKKRFKNKIVPNLDHRPHSNPLPPTLSFQIYVKKEFLVPLEPYPCGALNEQA